MGVHPLSPGLSACASLTPAPCPGTLMPSPAGPQSWGAWPRARFTEEGADGKRENKAGGGPGALSILPSDAGLALPNTGVHSGKRGGCRLLTEPPAGLTPPPTSRWSAGSRTTGAGAGKRTAGRTQPGRTRREGGAWGRGRGPPGATARATRLDRSQKRQKQTRNSRCSRWK